MTFSVPATIDVDSLAEVACQPRTVSIFPVGRDMVFLPAGDVERKSMVYLCIDLTNGWFLQASSSEGHGNNFISSDA